MSQTLAQYAALQKLYALQDTAYQELSSALKVPLCIPNCGKCCEIQTPVVTELEARYAVSSLLMLPNVVRKAALDRMQEWITRPLPGVNTFSAAPEARVLSEDERKALIPQGEIVQSSPCAFLGTDKGCLIYPLRPIACRAWGVTRPVQAWCRRPRGQGESAANVAYLTGLTAERIRQAIKDLGSTGICGFLPTLVMRLSKPKELQTLIEEGKVATARLTLGNMQPWYIFEEQVKMSL